MTHVAPLLALVLASVLRCAAAEASVRCTWTKVLPNEDAHSSFVRQDSASVRLYHSVWSEERALLRCSWSDDAAAVHGYLSLCRDRAHEFSDQPDGRFSLDPSALDQCVSLPSPQELGPRGRAGSRPVRSVDGLSAHDEVSEVTVHQRVKRGFIVPGTLWCGSGNKAPSYEDLGVFANTDSCCREHDQCKHTILSFHSEFGVFNTNIFTMSHCECDTRFRRCLTEANDSIAHAVGYTFFNLLKMHCFEFSHRLQCTQRNWFGMCKESKMALYAEVHPPTLFDSIGPAEDNGTSLNTTEHRPPPAITTATALNSSLLSVSASATTDPSPPSPPPSDPSPPSPPASASSPPPSASSPPSPPASASSPPSPPPSASSPPASDPSPPSSSPSDPSPPASDPSPPSPPPSNPSPPSPPASASSPPASDPSPPSPPSSPASDPSPPASDPSPPSPPASASTVLVDAASSLIDPTNQDVAGKLSACGVFKDLDKCRNKILPHETRFGVNNAEARTLYHCNCTSRLFQALSEQTRLSDEQALLLEQVSPSCFVPQDCSAGSGCTAVVVRTEFPPAQQRHLQAVRLRVRPKPSRAKRKGPAVTLHKLCLRMSRRKMNRSRKRDQSSQRRVETGGDSV